MSKKPPGPTPPPRHDTPVDVPAVDASPALPVRNTDTPWAAGPDGALGQLRALETLESAYDAWEELKRGHAASVIQFREEQARLTQQGSFLLGAVRAAGMDTGSTTPGLQPQGAASDFLRDAEARLAKARDAVSQREAESEARYQAAFTEVRATLLDRVQRYLQRSQPHLTLLLRRVGAERSILHVARVQPDEAVLLCYLLTQRVPSRYGFLFDDSTEDLSLPPAPLYAEESVASDAVRPDAPGLLRVIDASTDVVPLKGFIPLRVPRPGGGEDFFRLLQRGAVMEVEIADGPDFRSILTREESERFAGHLLRLKLEERIGLDIEAG
ncbi:hypothetical protein COCOR_05318 [Corallococcus coralloides DSM 2259]|uniref:Uncharacterized protein n=1 Tax=Corallococcus coralloides (strain ATCC 25202 / DSM 2259 / NBRC 100086 / M2) TaxID=1144275 RepID=H8MVX5_CORCM|nr:hypothetical protein [Corallococcus coralloides]AFE06309.1 hypothetical protein COCOR_05318 [Corallococcus coralloides DSM 2259]